MTLVLPPDADRTVQAAAVASSPAAALAAAAPPPAPPGALPGAPSARAADPRTRALLHAPALPLLLRLAWPNILVMLAQASTGLVETYWVSRLGTDALAGMALVFPPLMLMTMLSGGAVGGGISAAVARALGRGRRDEADALVLHALAVNGVLGLLASAVMLLFGPALYRAMGGQGGSLRAAVLYSDVAFGGNVLLWVMNALASVVRGSGNMLVPALVTVVGVAVLVPLSPCLIFGLGPFPALGVAGGGAALVLFYAGGALALGLYVLSRRSVVRPRVARLRWAPVADILRVGAVAAISSVQTNLLVAIVTALAGAAAGADAVAGYGTGARLEYLLVPLVFGLGAPLVALVGTNLGAGQRARALRVAALGAAVAFVLCETIGLLAAAFPRAWLGLFGHDPGMLAVGSAYLRAVGPFYGFFGMGLSLYFASQGAGRLLWPLLAGLGRVLLAVGGGWLLLRATGQLGALFAMMGAGLVFYGVVTALAVARGAWGK